MDKSTRRSVTFVQADVVRNTFCLKINAFHAKGFHSNCFCSDQTFPNKAVFFGVLARSKQKMPCNSTSLHQAQVAKPLAVKLHWIAGIQKAYQTKKIPCVRKNAKWRSSKANDRCRTKFRQSMTKRKICMDRLLKECWNKEFALTRRQRKRLVLLPTAESDPQTG